MTARELYRFLHEHMERPSGLLHDFDEPMSVILALPSIGPRANSIIKSAQFGLDWDKGLQFTAEANLVPKTDKQSVFEVAYELLAEMASKPVKRQNYEQRKAKWILEKYGCDEESFVRFRRAFWERK